jgi:hypothetical protein
VTAGRNEFIWHSRVSSSSRYKHFRYFISFCCERNLLTRLPDQDRQRTPPDTDSDMPSSALTSCSSTRAPLSTPDTTPAPSHVPTPRNSSPPPIPLPIADVEASTTGRERRVRKSKTMFKPESSLKIAITIKETVVPVLVKEARHLRRPD